MIYCDWFYVFKGGFIVQLYVNLLNLLRSRCLFACSSLSLNQKKKFVRISWLLVTSKTGNYMLQVMVKSCQTTYKLVLEFGVFQVHPLNKKASIPSMSMWTFNLDMIDQGIKAPYNFGNHTQEILVAVPSLKLTAISHLTIGWAPKGNESSSNHPCSWANC